MKRSKYFELEELEPTENDLAPNQKEYRVSSETGEESKVIVINHPEYVEKTKELTPSQKHVCELALAGETFFFSGPAGSGKSFILKELIELLHKKFGGFWGQSVYVTAPTGIAAANVGGITLHSFAGLGINTELPFTTLTYQIQQNYKTTSRWKRVKVLIIDEVSMLSAKLLELIDQLARYFKKVDQPFGGIQLILSGDFYQLPPVTGEYCFLSTVWTWKTVLLKEVFRQSDPAFVEFLGQLRIGKVQSIDFLQKCKVEGEFEEIEVNGLAPTKLFCANAEVDTYNLNKLEKLQDVTKVERVVFNSLDWGEEKLLEFMNVPKKLELCVGCQVLLLQNCPRLGLYNGSLGKVRSFHPAGSMYYGSSISTEQSLEGGPIVQFENGRTVLITRRDNKMFQVEKPVAGRKQYPLRLGWALTIHKSQGMTIPLLDVDLTKVFAHGQTYVAISRARSLEGLRIRGFNKKKVKVDPNVIKFYSGVS